MIVGQRHSSLHRTADGCEELVLINWLHQIVVDTLIQEISSHCGIRISHTMTSSIKGLSSEPIIEIPVLPSSASMTSYPAFISVKRTTFLTLTSSSTTKILPMPGVSFVCNPQGISASSQLKCCPTTYDCGANFTPRGRY